MTKQIMRLAFIIIAICTLSSYRNVSIDKEPLINWSHDRKLTWEDFKGKPTASKSNMLAVTCSNINFTYKHSKGLITNYEIKSVFIKDKSWTITSNLKALAHEQLHFDINELYARKIRKSFDSLANKNNYLMENYIKVYNTYTVKRNRINRLYDTEVYGNDIALKQWIKKINNELEELDNYEEIE